jgi:hypothetical protein
MPGGLQVTGPAVIESLESTILVPPGWEATMNDDGFVLLNQHSRRHGRACPGHPDWHGTVPP